MAQILFLHHGIAENIKMAVRGVKQAMQEQTCVHERVEGVSIYAEYTTSQAEWSDYRRDWLGP
jgi:hypothetical protein